VFLTDITSEFELAEQLIHQNRRACAFITQTNITDPKQFYPFAITCMLNVVHVRTDQMKEENQTMKNQLTNQFLEAPYIKRKTPFSFYIIIQSAPRHSKCVEIIPFNISFQSTAPFYYTATGCGYQAFPAFYGLQDYAVVPSIKLIRLTSGSAVAHGNELTQEFRKAHTTEPFWVLWRQANPYEQRKHPLYL